MNIIKEAFVDLTGYWIHKIKTLPPGTNLYIDIKNRIGYGNLETIFDIGANTGQTWKELRANLANSNIYCFEPIRETYNLLKKNVANDKKCIAENFAMGQRVGKMNVNIFDDASPLNSLREANMNHATNARVETISISTIDHYCLTNNIKMIDLLKIDTEGFELEVLMGSREMLSSRKIGFIYAEVGFNKQDHRHTPFHVLNYWLQDFGYYFFALYQLAGHSWQTGYYANALFVNKEIYKSTQ